MVVLPSTLDSWHVCRHRCLKRLLRLAVRDAGRDELVFVVVTLVLLVRFPRSRTPCALRVVVTCDVTLVVVTLVEVALVPSAGMLFHSLERYVCPSTRRLLLYLHFCCLWRSHAIVG